MSFSNQGKINNFSSETPGAKRWPVGTLVRLAVSVSLIGCIIWWMGGVGKIGAIMSRISFRFAMLVLVICTLDRALMTFKWILACASHFDRQCAACDCKDVPENSNSGSWK
jgi:hypothetical protein